MSASEEEENTGPVVPDPWLSLDNTAYKRITVSWQDPRGEVHVEDLPMQKKEERQDDEEKHEDLPPPCPWKRIKIVDDNYEEEQVDLLEAWEKSQGLVD